MALRGVTRRNVTPITGLGGFDLTIAAVPNGIDVLTVGVRVYVADKRLKPSTSLDDYISNWRARVAEVWNDKIEFRSKGGDRVKVRFDLQKTGALGGCHFPVELLDGYAQSSGLKFPSSTTDPFGGRIYLTLMDQDNLEYHVAAAETLKSGNVGQTPRTLALHSMWGWSRPATPGTSIPPADRRSTPSALRSSTHRTGWCHRRCWSTVPRVCRTRPTRWLMP